MPYPDRCRIHAAAAGIRVFAGDPKVRIEMSEKWAAACGRADAAAVVAADAG